MTLKHIVNGVEKTMSAQDEAAIRAEWAANAAKPAPTPEPDLKAELIALKQRVQAIESKATNGK